MTTLSQPLRVLLASAAASIGLASAGLVRADTMANAADVSLANTKTAGTSAASTTATAPFTRDQVIAVLTRTLVTHFNFEGDLQLELIRSWIPSAQVATVWDLAVVEFPTAPAASMMLRCRVLADGEALTETTFVVRAQLWRDGWVTRQPLTSGAAFDASALEARRVDVLRERDILPAAVGDRNYIFARAVPAGRMLTWRDIARRPLVKKGDLVEVAAVDGPLVVTMKGLAMENGAQGDTVTVRNPESRKDFAALVVSENRVQVRF
jgi:flagella basal body P-ring formation protein FlgA